MWRLWKWMPTPGEGKNRWVPDGGTMGRLNPKPPAWPPPAPPDLAPAPSDGSNIAAVTTAIAVAIDRWSMVRSLSPELLRRGSQAIPRHGVAQWCRSASRSAAPDAVSRRLPRQIAEIAEDAVARSAQCFHLFGQLRIDEPPVALHHLAGDQDRVDIGDPALHHDRADRIAHREHGDVGSPQQHDVGFLADGERAGAAIESRHLGAVDGRPFQRVAAGQRHLVGTAAGALQRRRDDAVALVLEREPHGGEHVAARGGLDVGADRHRRAERVQPPGERVAIAHLQLDLRGGGESAAVMGDLPGDLGPDVVAVHDVEVLSDEP